MTYFQNVNCYHAKYYLILVYKRFIKPLKGSVVFIRGSCDIVLILKMQHIFHHKSILYIKVVTSIVLKTETGTGTGRGSNRNQNRTGNKPVEPVSMNRFFKKYIKYLNFNEKNIFLRF
jgi:hypothetical protein